MLLGIHHVTALAADPQKSLSFCRDQLGLRLVKHTVNFDDPATHHFYFGDRVGNPGTLLTYFAGYGVRSGARQTIIPCLEVSGKMIQSLRQNAGLTGPETRFSDEVWTLHDPDGIEIEMVQDAECSGSDCAGCTGSCSRVAGVTILSNDLKATTGFLTGTLGLWRTSESKTNQAGHRVRFRFPAGGDFLDVVFDESGGRSRLGAGTVHHAALRVADEAAQAELREKLIADGHPVTLVRDRVYFRSIYFRDPGGALLEVATGGPGFTVDEPEAALGEKLCLPPWLEPVRENIAVRLKPVQKQAIFEVR